MKNSYEFCIKLIFVHFEWAHLHKPIWLFSHLSIMNSIDNNNEREKDTQLVCRTVWWNTLLASVASSRSKCVNISNEASLHTDSIGIEYFVFHFEHRIKNTKKKTRHICINLCVNLPNNVILIAYERMVSIHSTLNTLYIIYLAFVTMCLRVTKKYSK